MCFDCIVGVLGESRIAIGEQDAAERRVVGEQVW